MLHTHDRQLPNERAWEIPHPWWTVSGPGHFLGEPPFQPTSTTVQVTLTALHGDETLGDRGEVLISRLPDWRWAVPPDGCPALALPASGAASCDPSQVAMPSDPHDNRNPCCAHVGEPVGAHDPDAGPDAP